MDNIDEDGDIWKYVAQFSLNWSNYEDKIYRSIVDFGEKRQTSARAEYVK